MKNEVTFTITCTMVPRWIPYFRAMLKYMQQLGGQGSSRTVAIYSDGDGDFRPKFVWDTDDFDNISAEPIYDNDGNKKFDAG